MIGGMESFIQWLMASCPLKDFDRLTPQEREELADVHWNHLFALDGPKRVKRVPSAREKWWVERLFDPAAAIYGSFDQLQDIEVYVRRFPYRRTRVSRIAHLRHNVQVYFQEVYVLRDRTIAYLNSLTKDFAGSEQGIQMERINGPLCRMVKQALRPITDARKQHVHELGYVSEAISRIESLELFSRHGADTYDDPKQKRFSIAIQITCEEEYKKERNRWTQIVKQWNKIIKDLLDQYFVRIGPIVFSRTGELIYPPIEA